MKNLLKVINLSEEEASHVIGYLAGIADSDHPDSEAAERLIDGGIKAFSNLPPMTAEENAILGQIADDLIN